MKAFPCRSAIRFSRRWSPAIGDAENDQVFLRRCGLAVAVDNALPSVKALADMVTPSARGAGVTELITQWLDGGLDAIVPDSAKHQHS